MKKLLFVLFCCVVAASVTFSVGCTKTADPVATNTPVPPTATNTQAVTPTITPTIVSTPIGPLTYSFDAGIEGWENDTPGTNTGFTSVTQITGSGQQYAGVGSVEIAVNLTGSNQGIFAIKSLGGTTSLVGKTVTVHVYLPANLVAADYAYSIFVQSKSDWSGWENNWILGTTLTTGWNTITFSPTSGTTNQVQAIGFNLQSNGQAAATGTIYVDEVSIN